MKYFLTATFAASAMLFCACGDDSSSNATGNNENAAISISTEGTYSIDKKKKMLVMTPNDSISACFMENGGLSWETLAPEDYQDSIEYELAGDTLILFNGRDGMTGEVYVGSNKGKIEGTWTFTGCDYNRNKKQANCDSPYNIIVWTFSNGKFKKKSDIFESKYIDALNAIDFTKSSAMYNLYEILNGDLHFDNDYNYSPPFYGAIFYPMEDDSLLQADAIDRYDVEIVESTKTSQTFKISDKTYTFKLNNVTKRTTENGRTEAETELEVSRDSITCVYHFIQKVINKDLCTYDALPNDGEFIGHPAAGYGKKEYQFREADFFLIDNQKSFVKCLESIDRWH